MASGTFSSFPIPWADPEVDGTTIEGNGTSGTPFKVKDGGISAAKLASNAVTTSKIADANVTNAKLANVATATIKGRTTAGTGAPEDLTKSQAQAILSVDDLVTLSGVADGATHLGTFTGSTISDNQTVKQALQALETAVESGSGGGVSFDTPTTIGAVTAEVVRQGGTAVTLTNPSSGEYTLVIPSGAHLQRATVFGNSTTLNGSNEFLLRINNSANSRKRRVTVQLYDANNGALVNQFTTSTNHSQSVTSNVTLLTFPGMNGFGTSGFFIEIS
jgi:hypothetical protein